ncbi:MAG: hypothetical protein FH758_01600 [Firmicutes bacterium]|nr:hypothetical protein [Bacillota bacterium]
MTNYIKKGDKIVNLSNKLISFLLLPALFVYFFTSFSQLALSYSFEQDDKVINMSYMYFGDSEEFMNNTKAAEGCLNTVIPSYFDIDKDGELVITNKLDPKFIEKMHSQDIKVVPFLSNHWNREAGEKALENREKLATEIVEAINKYNLDGVNVDIENLSETNRDDYVKLVKLLREKLPEGKEISVAVVANPNGWTKGWHGSYDYKKLSQVADYLIIMAYDEHWEGSESGPVASISFVEDSIKYALSKGVPAQRLILGVPFYGRIWKVDDTLKGRGAANDSILKAVEEYDGEIIFDEDSKSTKILLNIPNGQAFEVGYNTTLTEGDYEIWLEDSRALNEKLKLVSKYNLKGTSSWSLSQAPKETWELYGQWLSSQNEVSLEDIIFSLSNQHLKG